MKSVCFKILKTALILSTVFFFLFGFSLIGSAENEDKNLPEKEVDEEKLLSALPEDFSEYFKTDSGAFSLPDLKEFLQICFKILSTGLHTGNADLQKLLGVVLLCSIFTVLEECLKNKQTSSILRLTVLLSGSAAVFVILKELFLLTEKHLASVSSFLTGVLPLITGAQIAMGEVSTASVSYIGLQMVLSLVGEISCGLLLPLLMLCPIFELSSIITENKGLLTFSELLRKLFLTLLGGLSTLILTAFAFQNIIASKTDSLALRAFRYTAGNLVPMVGSAISESSKTLFSSLELMKVTVGVTGVFVILLMLLPPFLKLILGKFSFSFLNAVCKATDNKVLSSLFSCGGTFTGALAALVALNDLTVLISFAVTVCIS